MFTTFGTSLKSVVNPYEKMVFLWFSYDKSFGTLLFSYGFPVVKTTIFPPFSYAFHMVFHHFPTIFLRFFPRDRVSVRPRNSSVNRSSAWMRPPGSIHKARPPFWSPWVDVGRRWWRCQRCVKAGGRGMVYLLWICLQCGAPHWCERWFINPMNYSYLRIINHSYWSCKPT